jgi:hypothetical protein
LLGGGLVPGWPLGAWLAAHGAARLDGHLEYLYVKVYKYILLQK